MKNQTKSFPLTLFCGGELLILMIAALMGVSCGMRTELTNVARANLPQAGWDVPIRYLDYLRFFLAFGVTLVVLTALWLFACLRHSRRATLPRTGASRWLPWVVCIAAALFFGFLCGEHLPLWEYGRLIAYGSQVPAASGFHLPSAALGTVWAAAGFLLIGLGTRPAHSAGKSA